MHDATHEATAKLIVRTLSDAGHTAYYAGGFVRDTHLGIERRDAIDVATSASPKQVFALFKRTVGVGAQFGVIEENECSPSVKMG